MGGRRAPGPAQAVGPVGSDSHAHEPDDADAVHDHRAGRPRRSTTPFRRRCRPRPRTWQRASWSTCGRSTSVRRRHIAEGGAQFIGHNGLTLGTTVRHTDRRRRDSVRGQFRPRQRGRDARARAAHAHRPGFERRSSMRGNVLVRGGYTGSWFHNDVTSLTFDNPWRVSDSTSAGSRGRPGALAEQLVRRRQRARVVQAALQVAGERVRLARQPARQRGSAPAVHREFTLGVARARPDDNRGHGRNLVDERELHVAAHADRSTSTCGIGPTTTTTARRSS